MGLTSSSVGRSAIEGAFNIQKKSEGQKVIALAGNPNVGKSTVFNALTGMNQHTGNWAGKTVSNAQGYCESEQNSFVMVDIPGTYSLMARSGEEEVARDFICFGSPDAVAVVCDATCLERNLNLVLQIIEVAPRTVVCVNLLDEAKRKNIKIDLEALSEKLGVEVVGVVARKKKTLDAFLRALDNTLEDGKEGGAYRVKYPEPIEKVIADVGKVIEESFDVPLDERWLSLKLLEGDGGIIEQIERFASCKFLEDERVTKALETAWEYLYQNGISRKEFEEQVIGAVLKSAQDICHDAVVYENKKYDARDRRLDRILTSRATGYPIMLALLALVFWITITGANYISGVISSALFYVQDLLTALFELLRAPAWLHGALVLGVYRVLAWVVSVMLPPMAIFFPLFTLLEDAGYLPRIAYNLDNPFRRCNACGKQALTMCMGFGCNAAGVVGCRIIDSPRERILAIVTNAFVPCNGKFPMLIAIITIFFVGASGSFASSVISSLALTAVILLGIVMTFVVTRLLSSTLLRGVPSSFALELPPYRRPQVGRVIIRSIFDRTLFVLGRAASVAAPVGMLIWIMANVTVADVTLLRHCAAFLDPVAQLMGLDGVILLAFILGFPANEIVVPIIIMTYLAEGSITEAESIWQMKEIFVANGWTLVTAASFIIFSLFHWPCSTTLMTVKKETGSVKWTLAAALIPTAIGMIMCIVFAGIAKLFV